MKLIFIDGFLLLDFRVLLTACPFLGIKMIRL
jgi:hypothetical protein